MPTLENKTSIFGEGGCAGCFIYPSMLAGITLLVWSCGYISGKFSDDLKIQEKDIIGKEEPEKFYEIKNKRAYLTVDGTPVEEYFKK